MIYLVCGAPGSGKTYYVKNKKLWNDWVLDLDYLYMALTYNDKGDKPFGTLPIMQHIFETIFNILITTKDDLYIIKCAPTQKERNIFKTRYNATVIYIDTFKSTCQKRRVENITASDQREGIMEYINKYFSNFEEGCIDLKVKGY